MKDKIQGYSTIHDWVNYVKGHPRLCEQCGTTTAKRYEWANVDGRYRRVLKDYRRLCVSCHRKEGFKRGEYESWNKGKHKQTNTGRTHFRKGHVPANKYIEPKLCKACGKSFQPRLNRIIFCSQSCYATSLQGKPPPKHRQGCQCFRCKGQEPWNKGLNKINDKRLDYDRPTQFKKGQVSPRKYLQPVICQRCHKEFQPRTIMKANKYCSQKCYWGH